MLRRRSLLGAVVAVAGGRTVRAEARTVTIAIQYGIGYLPVMIADRLGLFAAHARAAGTDVTVALARMSGATAVNDALISGSIDIGAYGLPGLLIAREKTLRNYEVRGLCSLSSLPYGLYTNRPGIRSVADIGVDDRIAVTAPNTPQAELLRIAAEKAFGDAHRLDTRMVSLPHPDATVALISGGAVTLYFATPPFSTVLDATAGIHRVTSSKEILGEEITGALLATTAKFAGTPGLAAAVVEALQEADGLIVREPGRAAALYLESEATKLSQGQVEGILREMGGLFSVAPSGTMAIAGFMARQGELKAAPARWQDAFFSPVSEGAGS